MKKLLNYFSPFEWCLWLGSVTVITLSFLWSKDFYFLTLVASLVGVSSLIFIAKGNVIGQFLIILFSILYGIVSLTFSYYGEFATYVFMSLPSAVVACITWLKNPSKRGKAEVAISTVSAKKWVFLFFGAALVTTVFYFVLKYLNTANLIFSTISVFTSFFAAMLLILRSPYYALGYAANDIVLIVLWVLASLESLSYLPMVFCFLTFFVNDGYGFLSWKKRQKQQNETR